MRNQNLRQRLVKYVVKFLPRRNWEMNIFTFSLCPGPGGQLQKGLVYPFENSFLFDMILWDSCMLSLIGYQS